MGEDIACGESLWLCSLSTGVPPLIDIRRERKFMRRLGELETKIDHSSKKFTLVKKSETNLADSDLNREG